MSRGDSKQPRIERAPKGGKSVRIENDPGSTFFRWKMNRLDYGGPWGWHLVHPCYVYRKIIPDLQSFEGMDWQQVYRGQSKGSAHSLHGSKLHRKAQDRLRKLDIELDQDFIELKIDHKNLRLWGIRNGHLNILWWDPHHEIYATKANKAEARHDGTIARRPPAEGRECPYSAEERSGNVHCENCWTQEG